MIDGAASVGEIEVALRAGFIPEQIVFTGVGKTPEELERAVSLGVKAINAESAGELGRISAIARRLGTRARVAVRVNPDIDARSHPHISTGLRTNKFGVPIEESRALYRDISNDTALQASGIHLHLGSQITTLEPLAQAAARVVALAGELREDGIALDHVDLGGGLGISYDGAPVDPPKFVVRSGLYRITRNPMYVAVVTTLLGEALLFDSVPIAVWAAVVAVTVHLFVVLYEEPTLHRQFGEPYDDYRAAVPRWIGPRRAVTPVTPRRGT